MRGWGGIDHRSAIILRGVTLWVAIIRLHRARREEDPTSIKTDFLPDAQQAANIRKPVAAVQFYQLHYLNKSENWVTRGIRAEFSGSYMVERVTEKGLRVLEMLLRAKGYRGSRRIVPRSTTTSSA